MVLPVHNEEKLLPYTLPNLFRLRPEEVILVLDRCTDRSEVIARMVQRRRFTDIPLRPIKVEEKSEWSLHLNYLYDLGIRSARSDVVLLTQADVLLDYRRIPRYLRLAQEGGLVSFGVSGHPHLTPYNGFITMRLVRIGDLVGIEKFSGTLAFSKQTYRRIALTPGTPHNFDTHLLEEAKRRDVPYHFIPTRNFNLRPRLKASLRFDRILWELGVAKYRAGKRFHKVLAYSLLRMTPAVMAGWLQAKLASEQPS